jgi:hypothetical protein
VLSHGRVLYNGAGGFAPSEYLVAHGIPYQHGYNVADHLLEVASDPPVSLLGGNEHTSSNPEFAGRLEQDVGSLPRLQKRTGSLLSSSSACATTFFTQLEVLCGREWKNLKRWDRH